MRAVQGEPPAGVAVGEGVRDHWPNVVRDVRLPTRGHINDRYFWGCGKFRVLEESLLRSCLCRLVQLANFTSRFRINALKAGGCLPPC